MKPCLRSFLILALLFPGMIRAAAPPQKIALGGGITIEIPADWKANTSQELQAIQKDEAAHSAKKDAKAAAAKNTLVLSAISRSAGAAAYVRVIEPSPVDPKKIAAASKKDLEELGWLLVEERKTKDPFFVGVITIKIMVFRGHRSIEFVSAVKSPMREKGEWMERMIKIFTPGRMVEVGLTCRGSEKKKYEKELDGILRSLRF